MNDENKEVNVFWLRIKTYAAVSATDDRIGAGEPVTLVAYTQNGPEIRYAFATQGPNDKFNRKQAHDKVRGRLRSTDAYLLVDEDQSIGPEATIAQDIMDLIRTEYGPYASERRAYHAASDTLKTLIERHQHRVEKNAKKASEPHAAK